MDIQNGRDEQEQENHVHPSKFNFCETLDADCVGDKLRVRGRLPGDRFQPLGMERAKSLREFMIDARIPRRWRDGLPLMVSERGIVCVPGWRIAHWARVTEATRRVLRVELSYMDAQDRQDSFITPPS